MGNIALCKSTFRKPPHLATWTPRILALTAPTPPTAMVKDIPWSRVKSSKGPRRRQNDHRERRQRRRAMTCLETPTTAVLKHLLSLEPSRIFIVANNIHHYLLHLARLEWQVLLGLDQFDHHLASLEWQILLGLDQLDHHLRQRGML